MRDHSTQIERSAREKSFFRVENRFNVRGKLLARAMLSGEEKKRKGKKRKVHLVGFSVAKK